MTTAGAGKIYSAIPKVMKDVGAIGKHGFNPHDRYNFRSIDDVYNALQMPLANNGVFFVPEVLEETEQRLQSAKGTDMVRIKLKVRYSIYADDGSFVTTTVSGEAIDRCDKATNKALTAALKYMLIQVFCIAVEQEDADKESPDLGQITKDFSPQQNKAPIEKPRSDKVPVCTTCGSNMVVSKDGTKYYCPNFRDKSKGEHPWEYVK